LRNVEELPSLPESSIPKLDVAGSSPVARSMQTSIALRQLAIAVLTASCGTPVEVTTGLSGSVHRGPVAPVCQVGVPCDVPFAASFDVRQGSLIVATFQSDSGGHFTVSLAPGTYLVVPRADAPLMNPATQTKSVAVDATGLTSVQLLFDTGIR
jgi:hypothetical protein